MPVHLDLCSATLVELRMPGLLDPEWVDAEFDAIVAAEFPNKPPRRPVTQPHRSPRWPRGGGQITSRWLATNHGGRAGADGSVEAPPSPAAIEFRDESFCRRAPLTYAVTVRQG